MITELLKTQVQQGAEMPPSYKQLTNSQILVKYNPERWLKPVLG